MRYHIHTTSDENLLPVTSLRNMVNLWHSPTFFTEITKYVGRPYFTDNSYVLSELIYDDGLRFIYFNTKGTKGGNAAIYNLLKYIQSSKADNVADAATQQLHQYVSRVKVLPETRLEYMRFDELMAYAQIEGRAEGRAEGILETRRNMIFELLEEYGDVPETLRDRINNETSEAVLKGWLKTAVKTQSIEEFVLNIE